MSESPSRYRQDTLAKPEMIKYSRQVQDYLVEEDDSGG